MAIVSETELRDFARALSANGGNLSRTARELGMSLTTAWRRGRAAKNHASYQEWIAPDPVTPGEARARVWHPDNSPHDPLAPFRGEPDPYHFYDAHRRRAMHWPHPNPTRRPTKGSDQFVNLMPKGARFVRIKPEGDKQ